LFIPEKALFLYELVSGQSIECTYR